MAKNNNNVLVIGSGGREHAIVWKLSQSSRVATIFVAPGSHAIQQVANNRIKNTDVNVKSFNDVAGFCQNNNISLVVVGPEDPLANGIADALLAKGIAVFGPQQAAARIEYDKNWAKSFMDRHGIPTAKWKSFQDATEAKQFINSADYPALVVKASGLAAGKGVVVATDRIEACRAVDDILTEQKYGAAGTTIVVEELLSGEEVSVLAFCDGVTVRAMLPAQDHKRIFDGDLGPNTGGMGAYCPCPLLNATQLHAVERDILERTVNGFQKDQIKFVGVLYAGLMLTKDGDRVAKVLEFNCRFGDPETEVILPLLESDLYSVMEACCIGTLSTIDLKWKNEMTAVGVVMASKGYPESSSKGQIITGIEDVVNKRSNQNIVFHCGTNNVNGNFVTNGGRVLIVVSLASQLAIATARATEACDRIQFDGKQYRRDIAFKGIAKSILQSGRLTYKESGVDITAGNNLIDYIKPLSKSTQRAGVLGSLGGFGGLFDTKTAGYQDPLLVSGTDGVGTKLKIAKVMGIHDTIGIDLVAMCVNDVLAHGAEPLFFLDYFACGQLDVNVAKQVITGIAHGCQLAGCALIGGETAEMPDMYACGDYDLAGFTVGAVERKQLLPHTSDIKAGDVVIGLASSGCHSNGFSLVRKVMQLAGVNYHDRTPFGSHKTFGEELLTPTKIYVKSVIATVKTGKVKAFAHITGGGILENIPRVLPKNLSVELDATKWSIPEIFPWLASAGGINEFELLRTFNCGIGGIIIANQEDTIELLKCLSLTDDNNQLSNSNVIGHVVTLNNSKEVDEKLSLPQVNVNNFADVMNVAMRPFIPSLIVNSSKQNNKRVGVLISGSGTNLQALIDATLGPRSEINAEIVLVISNKDNVEGLNRAQRANIPTKVLSHKDYKNRVEFDRALDAALIEANVEIVCLAGFMRILTGEFTSKWTGRLLNVHPALLPLFKGTHAQKQALEAGVRVSGCTVHFVEENVDAGFIIAQETVPVNVNDSIESLTERIKVAEHKAYPYALKLVATGKVKIENNQLIWSL